MSVVLLGSTSGSITLQEPAVAGTNTVNFGANTGVAILDANTPAFRNRIINGDMRIDQRNAGASVTGGVGYTFPVDRFKFYSAGASKLSGQRSTTAPTGFVNSLLLTSLAATSPGAGDEYQLYQNIEGFNVADLGWGTANAQTVTLSFWVRSSLTGTFAGCLYNNGGSRSYIFTYTVSAADTYEYKTITISGDTSGTWLTTNADGINIIWDLGSGSNLNGTAGSWASAFDSRTSGSVTLVGTNGATFYITGVQLEKSSTATSFDYRSYGTELALCQRYFQTSCPIGVAPADGATSVMTVGSAYTANTVRMAWLPFIQQMRATPTATFFRSPQTATAAQWGTYDGAWTAATSTTLTDASAVGMSVDTTRAGAFTAKNSYLVTGVYTVSAEL
jgi:hypothetical protein